MCADKQDSKTALSKNILEMKFMQRSALRDTKKESEEAQTIDDEHWVLDIPNLKEKDSCYLLESSYGPCEDLLFGRMSYKGFNKEVEKLMKVMKTDQDLALAKEREKELSVNDEEMASRYESLVGTIAKKFAKKRHRKEIQVQIEEDGTEVAEDVQVKKKKDKKSKKFLKPAD